MTDGVPGTGSSRLVGNATRTAPPANLVPPARPVPSLEGDPSLPFRFDPGPYTTPSPPLPVPAPVRTSRGHRAPRRDLTDLVVLVVLAATSIRVVASVVAGVIGWGVGFEYTPDQRTGMGLQWTTGFADIAGVILPMVVLGLLWWRIDRLRRLPLGRISPAMVRRTWLELVWLIGLCVVTAVGAVGMMIGTVLYQAGSAAGRLVAEHVVEACGFELAYLVVVVGCGLAATRLLEGVADLRDGRSDPTYPTYPTRP